MYGVTNRVGQEGNIDIQYGEVTEVCVDNEMSTSLPLFLIRSQPCAILFKGTRTRSIWVCSGINYKETWFDKTTLYIGELSCHMTVSDIRSHGW